MNVVLDLVGGAYFPASIEAMAPLGRLMIIGTMAGRDADDPAWPRALARGSRFAERCCAAARSRRRSPPRGRSRSRWCHCSRAASLRAVVDREYPLADVRAAHARMESNESIGKIVLRVS